MYDILIKAGRIIDPSQNLDAVQDLAINNGKIALIDSSIPDHQAQQVLDATGLIITPGWIDLHVHVYEGVSIYGIAADPYCINRGVTTVVDAGSSGAQTFSGFRNYIVEKSRTRILAFLNLSVLGMITKRAGELEDIRYADTEAAIRTIASNRDVIAGIKIRMEKLFHDQNGWKVLELASKVSQVTNTPVMYHIAHTDPPLEDLLRAARQGDIITHCFHSKTPGGILDPQGKVLPEVYAALDRGVYLDVGHGKASFSFKVARLAIEQGVIPHTISTDLHVNNIAGPVYDLATTLSKFLYLGLPLEQLIGMVTYNPARVLRREHQIGHLKPGGAADISIFRLSEAPVQFEDAAWDIPVERVQADRRLTPVGALKDGQLIFYQNHSPKTPPAL